LQSGHYLKKFSTTADCYLETPVPATLVIQGKTTRQAAHW
jgi:hypothetical protein